MMNWRLHLRGPLAVALLTQLVVDSAAAQERTLFDFQSAFWMNLHTYLHALTRGNSPLVEPLPDAASSEERERWVAGVAAYRERFGKRSLLFDDELSRLTWNISHAGSAEKLEGAGIDAETRALLERLAPIYRKHRWPQHDAANRAFIAEVTPLVARYGDAIATRLAKSYGKTWDRPARVDVVRDAGPPGNAHTVSKPLHITIGAIDSRYPGLSKLELLFHEASHGRDEVLITEVNAVATRLGIRAPRNLWHAILFFNSGAIATDIFRAAGNPGYRQIMYTSKVFVDLHAPVAKHWPAFLAGQISREEAIARILKESLIANP